MLTFAQTATTGTIRIVQDTSFVVWHIFFTLYKGLNFNPSQSPTASLRSLSPETTATQSGMPALPEGVPGPSCRVPEGGAASTIQTTNSSNGNAEAAAGRSRQRQELQVRLTPASHNSQMRALLLRNAEAVEGLLNFLKEKEEARKEFRATQLQNQQALLREIRRQEDVEET